MGTSGTRGGCAARGAAQSQGCVSSAHPLDRTLAVSALFQSRLSNLWPQVDANMRFTETCWHPYTLS